MARGLDRTTELFAPVRDLFGWVYRVAHELSNCGGLTGTGVREGWRAVVRGMGRCAARRADLAGPLQHFVKVSRSYEPGLFHCYDVKDLPRTNNDLEQLFGSHRFQPGFWHGQAGQFGDTTHGVLVDGHEVPAVIVEPGS